MELDPDTFLTTVYVTVDDLYQESFAALKPLRPGPKATLSDSEVLTLSLLAQWQKGRSERDFLRWAARHWQGYFPHLLSQSAFNRRARDLCGVLCALGPRLAARLAGLTGPPAYEAVDCAPVPLMRRCRGSRHRLYACEAAIGKGGSDRQWFYGVKLLATVSGQGVIRGFLLLPANTEERWGVEALLCWRAEPQAGAPTAAALAPVLGPAHRRRGQRLGPTGPIAPRLGVGAPATAPYVADRGAAGRAWQQHWQAAYGATVLISSNCWLRRLRQVVERTFACLNEVFGLAFPRARSYWGLLSRVGAKVAALNVAILINHLFGRPPFASFDLFG